MKKTLAAVLAAAMALSTASVAFAKDVMNGDTQVEKDITIGGEEIAVEYGTTYNFMLASDVFNKYGVSATQLGKWVDEGVVTVTPTVTSGMNNLESRPTASLRTVVLDEDVVETKTVWTNKGGWNKIEFKNKTVAEAGKEINGIPADADGNFCLREDEIVEVVYPSAGAKWTALMTQVETVDGGYCEVTEKKTVADHTAKAVRVSFKIADTWGTGSSSVSMKFRITFKKNPSETTDYVKGDTIMSDEVTFKAEYHKMNDKGREMELTLEEVSDRNVLMNKDDELYDRIGTDEFTVYFENTASFTGKMAPNQKVLNLGYSVSDNSAVVEAYPDIDFEFIEFKGFTKGIAPTFVNTGKMQFNAIGGADTTVYEMDSEGNLTELDSKYDKISNTVEVKGIKRLTSYVIAAEAIPEEEEPEEPAASAPTVEPSNDDEGGNPNTGAC